MSVHLLVVGVPVPQGSTRTFVREGRAFTTHAKPGPLSLYRDAIALAWERHPVKRPAPMSEPVVLHCTFVFKRPQAHYLPANRKRNERAVREDAPLYMTNKPDVDKLLRAVADALTGRAYDDDKRVVQMHGIKVYGDRGETHIDILGMDEHDNES